MAGLVHVHNRLLAVQPKRGLGPFLLVLLPGTEDPGLGATRRSGLEGQAADGAQHVADLRLGGKFVLRINPVMEGDQLDLILAPNSFMPLSVLLNRVMTILSQS